jgi:hypothetical protein
VSRRLRQLGLPSPYRRVWPDRRRTFSQFQELHIEHTDNSSARSPLAFLHTARALTDMTIGFSQFPAPHLRTNALMAKRQLLSQALSQDLGRKVDAHRLESGRRSITAQIERAGLRALVVDSGGQAFEQPEWPDSKTFWQADQEGLLVADNRYSLASYATSQHGGAQLQRTSASGGDPPVAGRAGVRRLRDCRRGRLLERRLSRVPPE